MNIQYKDVDEKVVKKFINRILRYLKSEKVNLSNDPEMTSFIKLIDDYAKGVFIKNKKQSITRKHISFGKFLERLKADLEADETDKYREKKIKHIELLQRRVNTLKKYSLVCDQNNKKKEKILKQEESYKKYLELQERLAKENYIKESIVVQNTSCKFYPPKIDKYSSYVCLCGMDMTFCNKNCAYATTLPMNLRSKVYEANVIVCGGTSGSLAYNSGGHGIKTPIYKKPQNATPRVIENERKYVNKQRRKAISEGL